MTVQRWGLETIVNTTRTGNQFEPAVKALYNGGYTIAWTSGSALMVQIYDAAGNPAGAELTINPLFGYDPTIATPAAASSTSGAFVVVASDNAGRLFRYNFNDAGVYTGQAEIVSTSSGQTPRQPEITRNNLGYAVVYQDLTSLNGDADIRVIRPDATSGGSGTVTTNAGQQYFPDIAQLSNNNLAVVFNNGNTDIRLRVYTMTLDAVTPNGADVLVNTIPFFAVAVPHITALISGGCVVVWEQTGNPFPGDSFDIRARIFDNAGNPFGNDFLVNSYTPANQGTVEVAALPTGGFVAVWYAGFLVDQIRGQIFDGLGQRQGPEFIVNTDEFDTPANSPGGEFLSVDVLVDGRIVVAWAAANGDGNGDGIRHQIIDPRDGVVNGTVQPEVLYGSDLQGDDMAGFGGGDTMFGLAGNDLINGGSGNDTVNGGPGDDRLIGGSGNDTLNGGDGDDLLYGGADTDAMVGGPGNDWYFVEDAADVVIEAAGEGTLDRVFAYISYTLTPGAEIEKFSTADHAGTAAINLTGNELANLIYGNAGFNILDGRGAADTLVGFGGDDMFYVDDAADVVIEGAGEGFGDRVLASVSYTLSGAAQVEKLTTADNAGTAAIALTGNGFANTIFGNAGANTLNGAGGADTLIGLGGDDRFMVDNAGDVVIEAAGEGTDQVFASVDYTLGAGRSIETLSTNSTPGLANLNLIGNELNNSVIGNAGSNAIKGMLGNDQLYGGGGGDAFVFNTALHATTNVDTILDFTPADDDIILASGIFPTISPGTLAASAFVIGAAALDADDRIIYNSATGVLLYDPAGTAGGTAVQFATLAPGLALTNADFIVV